MMQAWIVNDINDIRYEETETPSIGENEVLVKVKAAGICGSDIPRIYRDGAHHMPLIIGHEFSGEVVLAGSETGKDWMQKRVGVYPLIPCKVCACCQKGYFEMCKNYSYIGSRQNGAFAEYVAVPVENLIELPAEVSYEQGAMLEPMSVSVHAIRQAKVKSTDTVAVYGLGTIGMLLVMFLLEQGLKSVFVIGNKEFQKEKAVEIGVAEEAFCDSRREDVSEWVKKKTNGAGTDIVFECVGKSETFSKCVELAAAKGKICVVGNPHTDMCLKKEVYWKILRNQLTVVGTWNSSFFKSLHEQKKDEKVSDWAYVLQKLKEGRISPEVCISHRFSLDELEKGLHLMRDKSEEYMKVMAFDRKKLIV